MRMGRISSGKTRELIRENDCTKVISGCIPTAASTAGPMTATATLLTSEKVARVDREPPNIDVITGAAVAVGTKTQINTPVATISSHHIRAK